MAAQGQEPGTTQSCDSSSEVKELVRKWLQEFSSTDDVEITLLAVLIAGAGIFGITLVLLPLKWSVLLVAGLVAFLLYRHHIVKLHSPSAQSFPLSSTPRPTSSTSPRNALPSTTSLPAAYTTYILGSGGHTTELLETIRRSWQPASNTHRRYIISVNDTSSLTRAAQLETSFAKACRQLGDERLWGTTDVVLIPRARKVHQSFWTAPWSCLRAAIAAIRAVVVPPKARWGQAGFRWAHVLVTNGPANGFIVGAVVHGLKLLGIVPLDRARVVYIESWARSRTLSLTGRLFNLTGFADVFIVQHRELEGRVKGAVYLEGLVGKEI